MRSAKTVDVDSVYINRPIAALDFQAVGRYVPKLWHARGPRGRVRGSRASYWAILILILLAVGCWLYNCLLPAC